MEEKVMTSLLSQATEILTWVLTSIGSIADMIVGEPLLLIGVVLMLIGFVVGICKRLIATF